MGIDIFIDSGSNLYAPLQGKVKLLNDNNKKYDYGPTLILEHIYKKHKFIRCCNKIDEENGGEMFCIYHWDSINPYEDEYNKLVN